MANEVAKTNGESQVDPYQRIADETAGLAHITGHLLRFTKHGEWKYGQEMEELAEGTRMLAHLPGLKWGWVKWHDGSPQRYLLGRVADGYDPPPREELGDMDESDWPELNGRAIDPWQKTFYLVLLDESGELFTYVTSSKGGLSAIGQLSDAFAKRRRMKPDEIPIIELHARSYNHKDYGETFAPTLKITGWAKTPENFDELNSAMEQEAISDQTELFGSLPPPKKAEPAKQPAKAPTKPAAKPVTGKKKNGPSKSVRF